MPTCIFVPGTECCELYPAGIGPSEPTWVDYSVLAGGGINYLKLAPNGIDPQPPEGKNLLPGKPIPEYFAAPLAVLGAQLGTQGYKLVQWSYDWRKDIHDNGVILNSWIQNNVPAEDPCTIVGYSQGGLVARMAWLILTQVNRSSLVRRLITLGTPHQGTYNAPSAFGGYDPAFPGILKLESLGRLGQTHNTNFSLGAIVQTWPAIYEQMPLLGGTDNPDDPYRADLYTAANWKTDFVPSQAWLTYAAETFQPLLKNPESTPPSWVLTTVAGWGFQTLDKLQLPNLIGLRGSFGFDAEGDGVVTSGSALIVASAQFIYHTRHIDLTAQLVNSGDLLAMILDPRTEGDPTPPLTTSVVGAQPVLGNIPIPTSLGATAPEMHCSGGKCGC